MRNNKLNFLAAIFGFLFLQTSVANDAAIELSEITEGVWVHTSFYEYPSGQRFPSNGMIVRENEHLILIDTAWGELATVELLNSIQQEIGLPVKKAIVTHAHGDRAAGVDVLESHGIEVFSHPLTRRLLLENGAPVPNKTIEELRKPSSSTRIGKLEVFFPGAAHAMDNLMVWLPQESILFGGCAIRSLSAKSIGNTAHGDVASWLAVLQRLSHEYAKVKIVVPGHGKPGNKTLISHTLQLVTKAQK